MSDRLSSHLLATLMTLLGFGCALEAIAQRVPAGHFTLWQLPSVTDTIIMSYVLETRRGKVIVIDGGFATEAPYLRNFLNDRGDHVYAWFISHPHDDHVGALTVILRDPHNLKIDKIYGSLPTLDWAAQHEPGDNDCLPAPTDENLDNIPLDNDRTKGADHLRDLHQAVNQAGREVVELTQGQILEIDGVRVEILAVKNPEITHWTNRFQTPLNNSSVVMRVSDDSKSILFTGDLGQLGGEKLLKSFWRKWLRADYVQVAHHGQNGVGKSFYEAVQPTYCLWPTPSWLWKWDTTVKVRGWMDSLNVQKHYVTKDGLHCIR